MQPIIHTNNSAVNGALLASTVANSDHNHHDCKGGHLTHAAALQWALIAAVTAIAVKFTLRKLYPINPDSWNYDLDNMGQNLIALGCGMLFFFGIPMFAIYVLVDKGFKRV